MAEEAAARTDQQVSASSAPVTGRPIADIPRVGVDELAATFSDYDIDAGLSDVEPRDAGGSDWHS
jgi:hypothetical protein